MNKLTVSVGVHVCVRHHELYSTLNVLKKGQSEACPGEMKGHMAGVNKAASTYNFTAHACTDRNYG